MILFCLAMVFGLLFTWMSEHQKKLFYLLPNSSRRKTFCFVFDMKIIHLSMTHWHKTQLCSFNINKIFCLWSQALKLFLWEKIKHQKVCQVGIPAASMSNKVYSSMNTKCNISSWDENYLQQKEDTELDNLYKYLID